MRKEGKDGGKNEVGMMEGGKDEGGSEVEGEKRGVVRRMT